MIRRDLQPPRIHPVIVISAVDVHLRPAIATVAAQIVRQLCPKFGSLVIVQNVFLSQTGGPLQRRAGSIVPDSL